MKKRYPFLVVSASLIILGIFGSTHNQSQPTTSNATQSINDNATTQQVTEKVKPTCDGTTVTSGCVVDNISYSSYISHPAVAEKSHAETVTTYKQEIASYCTLCGDGTYSPSCATGRGACSHHSGVAQWNAPRYKNVAETSTTNVIDAPAQAAYFEKVNE